MATALLLKALFCKPVEDPYARIREKYQQKKNQIYESEASYNKDLVISS